MRARRWLATAAAAATAATGLAALGPAAAASPLPRTQARAAVLVDPPVTATTADISFASFNVCKVSCGSGRLSWEKRRGKVIRSVLAAAPDVLGVQEASVEYTRDAGPQYLDLAWRLEDKGYLLANPDAEDTDMPCTKGTHIFYRDDVMEPATITSPMGQFTSGLESLQARTSAAPWGNIRDRCFAWAYLRQKATGAVFLAVSAHLAVEKNSAGEKVRRASASALSAWAEEQNTQLGLTGLPVVLMADLNSYTRRNPKGAQYRLFNSGYRDSYSAAQRVNHKYTTSNHVGRSNGWPAGPIKARKNPERIDYVLVRNGIMPLRYEVFVRTKRNGRFVKAYQASDHNMVVATWRIPVAAW